MIHETKFIHDFNSPRLYGVDDFGRRQEKYPSLPPSMEGPAPNIGDLVTFYDPWEPDILSQEARVVDVKEGYGGVVLFICDPTERAVCGEMPEEYYLGDDEEEV